MLRQKWSVLVGNVAPPIAVVLLLVQVVIGIACAASGPDTAPDPSPTRPGAGELAAADTELLRQISVIDTRVQGHEQLLLERLSGFQLDRGQLFEALSEASPSLDLSRMHEVALQLGPVESLGPSHERYIRYLQDIAARSRSFEQTVEGEDFVAVHQYAIDIMVARAMMLAEVSPRFCTEGLVTLVEDCESTESLAGGDYSIALRTAFRTLDSQIGPRTKFFPAQYNQDEMGDAAAALLAGVVSPLERAVGSIQPLEPPLELRADHERIMRFLLESLAFFDVSAVEEISLERLTEVLDDFATLTEETGRDLSAAAKAIVSPFFDE